MKVIAESCPVFRDVGERNPEEMFCYWETKTWCDKRNPKCILQQLQLESSTNYKSDKSGNLKVSSAHRIASHPLLSNSKLFLIL